MNMKEASQARKKEGEQIEKQINRLRVSLRQITMATGLSYEQIKRVTNGDNYEIDTKDRLTEFLKGI